MILSNWLHRIQLRIRTSKHQIRRGRPDPIWSSAIEQLQSRELLSAVHPFQLSSLLPENGGDGSVGFIIATDAEDEVGKSVGSGDFNGDGLSDLIIGGGLGAYAIFGTDAPITPYLNLDGFAFDGTNGLEMLNGEGPLNVSSAGDLNGDGFDELLVASPFADANAHESGKIYVIFGKETLPPQFELPSLDGTNGFVINGIDAFDRAGRSMSAAGDVNGDGFGDIIIGAEGQNGTVDSIGDAYVVFGKGTPFSATLELSALDGTNGFALRGSAMNDYTGRSVSSAGDINGDGFDDIAIGAPGADPGGASKAGETYVVFGKATPFAANIELSTLDGTNGFAINGISPYDGSGHAVNTAGDLNGDGIDDLVIGAHDARRMTENGFSRTTGEAYVVFGSKQPLPARLELSSLNGTNGVAFLVGNSGRVGGWVSPAGDVNGDGLDDVFVADAAGGQNVAGRSFLVFGRSSIFPEKLQLSTLDHTAGIVINGIYRGGAVGTSASSAGDFNGDGFADLILGSETFEVDLLNDDDAHDYVDGQVYVIYGGNFGGFDAMHVTLNREAELVIDLTASGDDAIIEDAGLPDDGMFQIRSLNGTFDTMILPTPSDSLTVNAGGGDDRIVIVGLDAQFTASLTINGDDGDDVLNASAISLAVMLDGGEGDDLLIGGSGNDRLNGGAGGRGGNDSLYGGAGNDYLFGGAGRDLLHGGAGHDKLKGQGSNDKAYGDAGNDTVVGGRGNDYLDGGDGDDVLKGGSGRDRLSGGFGNDWLVGGDGNDWLNGLHGDDSLLGNSGNDKLFGGAGNDVCLGGDGNDYVNGQGGSRDTVSGGGGNDRVKGSSREVNEAFVFSADWLDRV